MSLMKSIAANSAALHWMSLSRAIDDRLIKLQRIGRVGVYGPVHGQEAAVVGGLTGIEAERGRHIDRHSCWGSCHMIRSSPDGQKYET